MPHRNTLTELKGMLLDGSISSVELTRHYLDRIDGAKSLNAFITVDGDRALDAARASDKRIAAGKAGSLEGIPIVHKDIFCTEGLLTTCGSKMLSNFVSPYDATVVSRLSNAGTVTMAKTNMDEFAMGSSNETSWYGPVTNPWDTSRVPGGSSGGSAAAVAARLTAAGTGTDTGGSIRQPAALCGITGLKPSYGRVSRYGMVAFASSLDQAGPLTVDAADAALMLNAMAGFDPRDSTSVDTEVVDHTAGLNDSLAGLRVGLPAEFFSEGVDNTVATRVHEAIDVLRSQGAKTVEVPLPNLDAGIPCYYVIAPAEASSNLARFDGVRYGHRAQSFTDLHDMYRKTRAEGFGPEVRRRIMIGTYALSSGYYDAYYLKAQRIRRVIANDFEQAWKHCDVIVGPTTPTPAFPLGAKMDDPVAMYLNDVFTNTINLAGLPGVSIPVGFDNEGLPCGMQIVGRYFDESKILNVAHRYQQATDWHRQIPKGVV